MTEQPTVDEYALDRREDRKPYSAPLLIVHGTIQELTQSVAGNPTDSAVQGVDGSIL